VDKAAQGYIRLRIQQKCNLGSYQKILLNPVKLTSSVFLSLCTLSIAHCVYLMASFGKKKKNRRSGYLCMKGNQAWVEYSPVILRVL
jgi:hypothetical protein